MVGQGKAEEEEQGGEDPAHQDPVPEMRLSQNSKAYHDLEVQYDKFVGQCSFWQYWFNYQLYNWDS